MLLSIITINLNNAVGLEKTLQSVCNQVNFTDYEEIVIDGGSIDDSMKIIEKYSKLIPILYYESGKDGGIYQAMNRGIRQASGEYCLFLNSGDFLLEPNTLEKISLDKETHDIIGCNAIDDRGKITYLAPAQLTLRHLLVQSVSHQACFIKRKLFSEIGLYSEDLSILSDFEFMLKCTLRDATYKKIDKLISVVESGGVSQTAYLKMKEEEKVIFSRIIPKSIYEDYIFYMNKKTYSHPAVIWLINNKGLLYLIKGLYRLTH